MVADAWHETLGDALVWATRGKTAARVRQHHRRMGRDEDYAAAFRLAASLRGYKSATTAKNQTPWLSASPRSADGEILSDLPTLRNRSRAANRDDALASGITNTLVRGVVGTGLRPQARTGDDAKDDVLEAVWRSRADKLSLGEGGLIHGAVQRLRYGKRVEDGDIFLRPAVDEDGVLWIENIEGDRVLSPCDAKPADPAGRIVDGVEKDSRGRVVAYWVLKQHPGETLTQATVLGPLAKPFESSLSKASFNRVDAASICHDRSRVTRPGQTRGVPLSHAILQDLRDLDFLMVSSLKRAQMAACLSVFLESSAEASDLIELTAEDYGYQLEGALKPGTVFRTFPGESVTVASPQGMLPDLDALVMLLARRIGAAVGLSPQAVLRMWEGVNYSGARTIKIDDRQTYRGERADFAGTSLAWEWRTVLEHELLTGNPALLAAGVTMDDLSKVEWIGDEEQWVDPAAEADAIETMLRLGLTTRAIEAARLGRDWKELLAQQAVEAQFLKDNELADPFAQPQVKRPIVQEMPAPAAAKKPAAKAVAA